VREQTLLTREWVENKQTFLDWDSQPASFKHYPHFCYRIKLSDFPSLQWLEQTRRITDERLVGEKPYYRLNVPSAGNLHPIEMYVQLRNVEGILSGIYHLDAVNRELVLIEEIAGEGVETYLGIENRFLGAIVMISLVPFRSSWKYALRSWRYLYLDLGHQIGSLALSAKYFGVKLTKMSPTQSLNQMMGMGEDEVIAAVYGVGEISARKVKPLKKSLMRVQPTDYSECNEILGRELKKNAIYTTLPVMKRYENFLQLNTLRRSGREFDATKMKDEVIEKLLYCTPPEGLEIISIVLQAHSMHLGVYRSMECVVKGSFVSECVKLLLDQRFVSGANMILFFHAGDFSSYTHIEAGIFAQELYMVCEENNVLCSGIGAFYDKEGSRWSANPLIYAVAIGGKV